MKYPRKGKLPGRSLPVLLLVLHLFGAPAASADSETPALLLKGPNPRRGLPFLSPNEMVHYSGEYRLKEGRAELFYLDEPFPRFSGWERFVCPGVPPGTVLYRFDAVSAKSQGAPSRILFLESDEYSLFLRFINTPEGVDCPFITGFLRGFTYFRSVTPRYSGDGSLRPPPFPAVVEY